VGRHSIWLSPEYLKGSGTTVGEGLTELSCGVKLPFQFGGRVQKYKAVGEASYPQSTIADEYGLVQWLASKRWAPPVYGWVGFEEVISGHAVPGWSDPTGAYGYLQADANKLSEPGKFSVATLRKTGMVAGSEGAWNDLLKQGNVINGYLVDVRRSWWDRLHWQGPVPPMPTMAPKNLYGRLYSIGSFPFGERDEPYQDTWQAGRWIQGARRIESRAKDLGFIPERGESVVDLGCCTGGMLQYASLTAPYLRCTGIDSQEEFLELARDLARAAGMNINYKQADLKNDPEAAIDIIKQIYPYGVDHVLMLSMGKHLGDSHWLLVDELLKMSRNIYLESNAVNDKNPFPWREEVEVRGGVHVGDSNDRNLRRLYHIPGAINPWK